MATTPRQSLAARLYRGEVSYDYVSRRNRWYTISAVLLIVAFIGLFGRGLNLGLEFRGGAEFVIPGVTDVAQVKTVAADAGLVDPTVTIIGGDKARILTGELTPEAGDAAAAAMAQALGVDPTAVQTQLVGPTWGGEITRKALQGLVVFLVLVTIVMSLYFQWKMALAALIALAHDVIITVGVYALTGFEVTPATVIGVLTILGFSLYDTVVVFDKVKENTRAVMGGSRITYAEAANLALNQTLVRSLNTTIVAVVPVLAVLVIGVGFLGAGTLKDLALSLVIGQIAGTYSSIFIATPLLTQLRAKDPDVQALEKRVRARRNAGKDDLETATAEGAARRGTGATPSAESLSLTVAPAGPRRQPRRNVPRAKR